MPIRRIPRVSLVESAIDQLRRSIEDGSIPSGTRLNQDELANAAGVSRTPIRHALVAMAREGLIEGASQGFRVVRLDAEEALDMYEVHAALEGVIARLAARRATPEGLAQLKKAAHAKPALRRSDEKPDDFHAAMAAVLGRPALMRLRDISNSGANLAKTELLALASHRKRTQSEDERAARAEHIRIYEAIAARNEDRAEKLAHAHWMDGRRRLEAALEEVDIDE